MFIPKELAPWHPHRIHAVCGDHEPGRTGCRASSGLSLRLSG